MYGLFSVKERGNYAARSACSHTRFAHKLKRAGDDRLALADLDCLRAWRLFRAIPPIAVGRH
jgi:hypothetical protein